MKKYLLFTMAIFGAFYINAQEIITNGTFEIDGPLAGQTGTEWGFWSGNGGSVEVIDGVAVATPAAASADSWQLQLEQLSFILENDVTYTVKFKAWADADRTIQLTIEDPNNGYALLGTTPDEDGEVDAAGGDNKSKWTIGLTTEATVYTRTVTIVNIKANTKVKFGYLLSTTLDKVYIDDVSMMIEGSETGIKNVNSQVNRVYPNPATDVLNVPNNTGITIFNLTGKQVLTSNKSQINISGLNQGVYFVKGMGQVQKLIVK